MNATLAPEVVRHALHITVGDGVLLAADLSLPHHPTGVVLFAHGSGSSRFSPRHRQVARVLNDAGLATVLADLLTPAEEAADARGGAHRLDTALLADRLGVVAEYLAVLQSTGPLPLGLFGAGTGAAAALLTAARSFLQVRAVVSRGGADLAGEALEHVQAPTLLIVGGEDHDVVDLNRRALMMLTSEKQLVIVPGATCLFEEPGALDAVASLARDWFRRCLPALR